MNQNSTDSGILPAHARRSPAQNARGVRIQTAAADLAPLRTHFGIADSPLGGAKQKGLLLTRCSAYVRMSSRRSGCSTALTSWRARSRIGDCGTHCAPRVVEAVVSAGFRHPSWRWPECARARVRSVFERPDRNRESKPEDHDTGPRMHSLSVWRRRTPATPAGSTTCQCRTITSATCSGRRATWRRRFVSLSEALDLTTPSGRAFAGMLAAN